MDVKNVLLVAQVVLSILIIVAVLMQVRGSGLGSLFGNAGGEFYRSKRGAEKLLHRGTVVFLILLVANSLAISYLYSS